jgi:type I restriction enzyme R subunit
VDRAILRRRAGNGDGRPSGCPEALGQRAGDAFKKERIVDREALDAGEFASFGGFKGIDRTFDGKLEDVLGDLGDAIWKDAG